MITSRHKVETTVSINNTSLCFQHAETLLLTIHNYTFLLTDTWEPYGDYLLREFFGKAYVASGVYNSCMSLPTLQYLKK